MKKYEYDIVGLDCANCANKIQVELGKVKGIENASVNFAKQKLSYETDIVSREKVEKLVKSLEPDVELISAEDKIKDLKNEKKQNENKSKFLLHILRLVIGTIVAVVGLYVPMPKILSTVLIILGYAILLYRTTKNAIKLLFKSKTINENLLITISCIGAYLVGKHSEGLMVIVLYEIGKILEEKAINKTRKSISDLMDIKPEYANLKTDNDIKVVSPADVEIGDIVVVKQGEKIPLDGIVVKGNASLNTSSLTGESKPQDVSEKSEVLSGSIVLEGLLEIKVTEKYENSTVSKILELVENATDKKAKTETFVNKAAKIYTPIVLGIAALVAIFLPLISDVPYGTENGSIYRALIFLVISCPCAIAISVPLCYFSGIGKSSKEGILIKGSDYLDGIKDIKEVVFDKTGTLTKGEFVIDKVELCTNNFSKDEVLEFAVLGVGKEAEKVDSTKIYVKIDEELAGSIYLKDEIKEGTKEAIAKLNEKGIVTKMFTGDNKEVASKIAEELGIKEYEAEMLPNDKYTKLEKEIEKYKESNGKVAFVGDGINDSPVLALSDIGISMGGVGSQVAIEASDVVIMTDAIEKINEAINISKKTSRIIKQNLTFSIGIKILVLVLSIFGIANMWEAVFADVGATLITVLNAIRILSK